MYEHGEQSEELNSGLCEIVLGLRISEKLHKASVLHVP